MEISAISGSLSVQSRISQQNVERVRSADELGRQSRAPGSVSSGEDEFGGQQELFAALTTRLEESNSTTIEISLNINVIKASLGNLMAIVLERNGQESANLLDEVGIAASDAQVSSDVRERYINALITAGIDDGGLFGTAGGLTASNEIRDTVNSLSTSQSDGRQLLLDLLIEELDIARDDAAEILNTLVNQPFQAVA